MLGIYPEDKGFVISSKIKEYEVVGVLSVLFFQAIKLTTLDADIQEEYLSNQQATLPSGIIQLLEKTIFKFGFWGNVPPGVLN